MDLEMQVELPIALYNLFVEQVEVRNCTVEDIALETMRKFLGKEI